MPGGTYLNDTMQVSGSVTALGNLFSVDVDQFGTAAVQITNAGVATVTYEVSDDNITWYSIVGYAPGSSGASGVTSTSSTVGITYFPLNSRYFRARVSAYTSGTIAAIATFRREMLPRHSINVGNSTVAIGGQAAHDAVISGNPVRVGARALTANYTAVASGDVADLISTLVGAQIQKPYSIPEADWSYAGAASGIVNSTAGVTVKAAAGAGLRNYLTAFDITTDALGGATEFVIRDGAAGTVIWRGKLQTTALIPTQFTFATPLKGSANTLLEIAALTAVTGGIYFNAQGYVAP